jgi:hypothetical protein
LPPSLQKISKEWYSEADQDIEKFDVIFNGIFLMAWCKGVYGKGVKIWHQYEFGALRNYMPNYF